MEAGGARRGGSRGNLRRGAPRLARSVQQRPGALAYDPASTPLAALTLHAHAASSEHQLHSRLVCSTLPELLVEAVAREGRASRRRFSACGSVTRPPSARSSLARASGEHPVQANRICRVAHRLERIHTARRLVASSPVRDPPRDLFVIAWSLFASLPPAATSPRLRTTSRHCPV